MAIHHAGSRRSLGELGLALLALTALAVAYVALGQAHENVASVMPVFSLPGGYYEQDVRLELGVSKAGAEVLFTLDGQTPTRTVGTVYTQPIHLSAATPNVTVVRARVAQPDGAMGEVVSGSYVMGLRAQLPVMSLIVAPEDLDGEGGIYANAEERGIEWERPVDVTYVDKDRSLGFHISAGIRIHGRLSRKFDKKSFRLYFRQEYGASRLEYPLFTDSDVRSFKRLVLHGGGEDWSFVPNRNWTLLRSQLADSLAHQLGGYAAHNRPVLLFINGEPWGIYQLRERLDEYFLADHYGVKAADFLRAPEYAREQEIVMGDRASWDYLMRFVETHDLADPAHYAYVQTQVDIPAFIDYNMVELYAANYDWPHHNVDQFYPRVQGGRWHWMFWDEDLGFGAYAYTSFDTNMMERVLEHAYPATGGRDTLLLRKLLENGEFQGRFLSRGADLLNTVLSPESVIGQIDELAAELEPDIEYEARRWSSTMDWGANIQELREFARERPGYMRQHMVEHFGLRGIVKLRVEAASEGEGGVAVNGVLVPGLAWEGTYFEGVPVEVTAAPGAGYRFAGWWPAEIPQTAVITLTPRAGLVVKPRFERVESSQPQVGDVVIAAYGIDAEGAIEGDWIELKVRRAGGVDLRGWRVTDNDHKTTRDEGSLIFGEAFGWVAQGTRIVIVASETEGNAARYGEDDLSGWWDGRLVVYVGNGNVEVEGWFNLGSRDNLVLLSPGASAAFGDDRGIDFISWSGAVTPASFGVLADGVLPATENR